MGVQEFGPLIDELRKARSDLSALGDRNARRLVSLEDSITDIYKQIGRPGGEYFDRDRDLERKDAIGLCMTRHMLHQPKDDGVVAAYTPSSTDIDEAIRAKKALERLFRTEHLSPDDRKGLTSFNFGGNAFILPPSMSSRVLSCLVEPFNLASLVHNETISAGSIVFPIDNVEINEAAWACQTECFANNPQPNFAALGSLEIKAESLRFVTCAGNDLLQDSAFAVETWLQGKVARGFENAISAAILCGSGLGMPQGLLNGGIPVCDVSDATPPGQFTWQDLVATAYSVPVQWHDRAVYLMNQRTLGLALTMSDAAGRPLLLPVPLTEGGRPAGARFSLFGFPVIVAPQVPDVAPGSTPIFFGDLDACYTLVNRQATTVLRDPFSAGGFCTVFRWEARVGGAVTCANAGRWLRVQ